MSWRKSKTEKVTEVVAPWSASDWASAGYEPTYAISSTQLLWSNLVLPGGSQFDTHKLPIALLNFAQSVLLSLSVTSFSTISRKNHS